MAENETPVDLFEKVDFEAWNGPDWALFRRLHSNDVYVDMFGEKTVGIDAHVAACQSYQAAVPESKVLHHSVRMAAGDWTAVISDAEGGVNFVTVAKWKDGAITEEYAYRLRLAERHDQSAARRRNQRGVRPMAGQLPRLSAALPATDPDAARERNPLAGAEARNSLHRPHSGAPSSCRGKVSRAQPTQRIGLTPLPGVMAGPRTGGTRWLACIGICTSRVSIPMSPAWSSSANT